MNLKSTSLGEEQQERGWTEIVGEKGAGWSEGHLRLSEVHWTNVPVVGSDPNVAGPVFGWRII